VKFAVTRLSAVSSTNEAAKELARAGAPEGTVVTADEQTAGRGTKGRSWHSAPGLGLYASVILRPPAEASAVLPLAAGIAAGEAVAKSSGIAVRLKWPNDLLWQGRKLGGVLCESGFTGAEFDFAVVGIGLNVGHGLGDFPDELRGRAVSLRMAAERAIGREAVLAAFLQELEIWMKRLDRQGGAAIAAAFASRAVPEIGAEIVVDAGEGPVAARYEGIASDGALLISTPSGPRRFLSAEIIRIL